jgi:hypothetical protein
MHFIKSLMSGQTSSLHISILNPLIDVEAAKRMLAAQAAAKRQ